MNEVLNINNVRGYLDKEKMSCEDREQKKLELKASLHVKKGQPLPDCPFRLKVTGKTNVDVIVGYGELDKEGDDRMTQNQVERYTETS